MIKAVSKMPGDRGPGSGVRGSHFGSRIPIAESRIPNREPRAPSPEPRIQNLRSVIRHLPMIALLLLPLAVRAAEAPVPALQRLVQEVQSYFPRVEGDVIELKGDQLVVSLGARDEIQRGAELLLIREGRELVHPKTKERLGHMESELGRVLIEEVSERYSVGRVVGAKGDVAPAAGDRVRISSGRVTIELLSLLGPSIDPEAEQGVIDSVAQALEQSGRFRVRLADLARYWIQQEKISPAALLKDPGLLREKVSSDYLLLLPSEGRESQRITASLLSLRSSATKLTLSLPRELALPRSQPVASRGEPPRAGASAPASTLSFFTPVQSGYSKSAGKERRDEELAKFDRLFVSVDLIVPKSDGIARVVATDGERLFVYRMESGRPAEEIRYAPWKRGQVLSVQFASLGSPDDIHVVVNQHIRDVGMASLVLVLQEKSLKQVAEDTTNILIAVDSDGDGLREALWGQRYDPRSFFPRGAVRRLTLQGNQLSEADAVAVPSIFRATGAAMANLGDSNGRVLVFIDSQRFLQIARGREIIWSSPERVGGGYVSAEVLKFMSGGTRQTEQVNFEPNLFVADLDGDGVDEVIIPRNVSPSAPFLNVGSWGSGGGGEVLVIYREGVGFSLRAITSKLSGLVSGVGLAKKAPLSLFVAVAKANTPPFPGGKSQFLLSESTQTAR